MEAEIDEDREQIDYWTNALTEAENEIFELTKPDVFASEIQGNVDDRTDEDFERLIFLLEQRGVTNPAAKTTYEFYKRLEFINEELKQKYRNQHQPQNG